MADKKYTQLPGVHQTPVIKNFFDTTVEQLFSKANVNQVSAYIGKKDIDLFSDADTYVLQPTADRDKFSLEPAVNTIDQLTGKSTNIVFYEDYLNILKSYGVNTFNQNAIFDTSAYTFLPPINIDKFINYQEYFWSPTGPTPLIVEGTSTFPINVEKDILGKKTYTTPSGIVLKNGMVVTFSGNYVIPNKFKNEKRFIVEGVGESIILHDKEQNFATVFSTEDYIPFDQTIIDPQNDTLIPTTTDPNNTNFLSGGLVGVENYVSLEGQNNWPTPDYTPEQVDAETGNPLWKDYVAPVNSNLVYIAGGIGAFDTLPFDSDNTQENPDYIIMQRGSKDNNVWSRINFWHHKQNFLDAGDQLPGKLSRATRPIIEFDRDIELFNFGTTGKFSVDISAEGFSKSEVEGRPTGASVDDVTLQPGNTIMFTSDDASITQYAYLIGDDGSGNVRLTRLPAETNPTNAVDGDPDFVPYTAQSGDVLTVKFGAKYQGVEYYWGDNEWIKGQQKTKINTPITFNAYDANGVSFTNDAIYTSSNFKGNKIFGYTSSGNNRTEDPVLGFPVQYKNFNNFSEISFTNYLEDYDITYTPFGGTSKSRHTGYIYYKKTLPNGETVYHNMWRPLEKSVRQHVEDRYIISEKDASNEKKLFHISAKPENYDSDIAGLVEKSIRVYLNGNRIYNFSFDNAQNAITFSEFAFKRSDVLDINTSTTTGYIINPYSDGRYNIPLSWHSNLNNLDIKTTSQPEYLDHFRSFVLEQDNIQGDPLGSNNFDSIEKDIKWANKIVQTDDDLQLSAFLFSNDTFNVKDSIAYCAEEYVKYKNRLKKEIVNFVNNNDYSEMPYGEMLESVVENVIAYNQGKNVFDNTFMIGFSDQYLLENIVVNSVLKKEYILANYVDLNKIQNIIYVYNVAPDGKEELLCIDEDYQLDSSSGIVVLTFTDDYTLTLGNTIRIKTYKEDIESAQVPPTPSAMGLYPLYYPEIFMDDSFVDPIKMIRGHDGSKTIAVDDVHDFILLEFERRIYNATLQQFRDNDSVPDLSIFDVRPGAFRNTGRSRDEFYGLLRSNFNLYIDRNEVDFVKNEFYDSNNLWTWNYNSGSNKPSYWRGIYENCYDTDRPHTHPWEMLGFTRKPVWWTEQYGTDFGSSNTQLWQDLEEGIIRKGSRANVENDAYKTNNPYRRIGLRFELPVDASGNRLPPANITSTISTKKELSWSQVESGTASSTSNTFISVDGLSINEIGDELNITTRNRVNHTTGRFPTDDNTNIIADTTLTYRIESKAGDNPSATSFANAISSGSNNIGICTNGALIFNANTGISYNTSNWHYNSMFRNELSRDSAGGNPDQNNIYGYVQPSPQTQDLENWDSSVHSPIIGWSFDGFPIYGPYGYEDRANVSSAIVRLESGYKLKTTNRDDISSGPGGLPTGEFIEDFEYVSSVHGLDEYNGRYGPTPEFPNGTYYYVATIDSDNRPAFPYTVGLSFAEQPADIENNSNGTASLGTGTSTYERQSTLQVSYSIDNTLTSKGWKFSDGAPVENAWRISEGYPFAVVQALLLSRPGKFSTVFVDPRKPVRKSANTNQLLDNTTNKRLQSKTAVVHGEVNALGETTYTVGFTQFIDAFMKFQGLNTTTDFAKPLRTLNSKLGHKFAGYVDKDTMTVFSDSYSSTGNSSSLILPQEDIDIDIHVGPYSTTNDYTGVLITYTADKKYKVEGYNHVKRYFDIEESNKNGPKTEVTVGGEPVDFSNYDNTKNYQGSSIVKSGYNYYRAKQFAGAGTSLTDTQIWERLPSLPMQNAAEATLYLQGTGTISKVEYGTVFDTVNDVFDFLISLGRIQESYGYNFGEFNSEINDLNNWTYSGRQFLFWSIGKWASGNTLNLSPAAGGIKFIAPLGRVSKIIDIDQGQYSIVDQEGKSIKATECQIVRDGTTIDIVPPDGKQIYGVIVYTNEIEHAMVVSNKTIFGDTIFNDVLNQRQRRLKIKGKRTANWNGTLTAEGYIITEDGLKPNFDTLASDMGKYNEIGHVPVEKQLYDASRRQYGYNERKYLREFELTLDDQYDFYVGMIRSKGTKNSIEVLLNSDKVLVPGSVAIYDEWALKAGEFGDVDNYQTLDVRIADSEIVSERQLIQIAYPEDIVSKVKEVEVLDRTTKFYQRPFLEIEPPPADIPGSFEYGGGTTAQATVNIGSDGRISDVVVTEPGYGYTINPSVTVIAAQLLTANITTTFLKPYAISTSNVDVSNISGTGNILITDNFSSNVNTVIDLSAVSTVEDIANVINETAGINANITASFTRTVSSGQEEFYLTIKGNDFTLAEQGTGTTLSNVLFIDAKRYQPRQRYSFQTANSTSASDIVVTVDGVTTSGGVVGASNVDWVFDPGSRTTITTTSLLSGNVSQSFTFTPGDVSDEDATTDEIAADNLNIINGSYPHIDVEINGIKLPETSEEALYTITSNVVSGTSTITFLDCDAIPGAPIQPNSKIEIIEKGTIDLEDTYQGDLPGSTMNIKVFANDALAAKLEQMRTYEIYPDAKDDATILIDVDDSIRLPVRPTDMSEKGLWPLTSSVSYVGIVDTKYSPLPNAGYVSKYNVQYRAFDIYDFERLFDLNRIENASKLPKENDLVHFAKGEHEEFDVYKLTHPGSNISYIEYDDNVQTTFLWADISLSNTILDFNDGSNVDSAYNHTKWFDYVLALNGKSVIAPYYRDLITYEGNPIYAPNMLEINTPVVRFVSEEKVADSFIEMGNITHTVPDVRTIDTITPQTSGNITRAQPVAYQNTYQHARATVLTPVTDFSIFRSVDAYPYNRKTFNNQLTFTINNGRIDGLQVGHWLRFHDTSLSNLDSNIFQVASIETSGNILLYANTTVLGGMTDVIPKANLSFINFGKNRYGNADIDYDVQIVADRHGFKVGDEIVFNVDNLGAYAGNTFIVKDSTTNTLMLESGKWATTDPSLNVITDSANISLAQDTIKITAIPNSISNNGSSFDIYDEALVDGMYVTFKDKSGTELHSNSFVISNIQREEIVKQELVDAVGVFGNITTPIQFTVESSVTNSTTIPLDASISADGDAVIEPNMYMHVNGEEPNQVISVAYDFSNRGNEPVRLIETANLAQNNITISNTNGVNIGDVVLVSAKLDEVSNVTVTAISGSNITLSESIANITVSVPTPDGQPYNQTWNGEDNFDIVLNNGVSINSNDVLKFLHNTADGKVANVVVKNPVSVSQNDTVEFAQGLYETPEYGPVEVVSVTTFHVHPDTYSGSDLTEANLSFTLNDATKLTVDADLSTGLLVNNDFVKINAGGVYDNIYRIKKLDTANSSFVINQTMIELPRTSFTVVTDVSASNIISVVQSTRNIAPGMQVAGPGIPENTKIDEILGSTLFTVDNDVTLTGGDILEIYRTSYEDATFMSANSVITTRDDHGFATDGSDLLINRELTVYMMDPDYYNNTMKVVDIPTANTVVVDYPAFSHPYTIDGVTYRSKFDYDRYGEDAPGISGAEGWTPYFIAKHLGNIALNGANVVTNAYPWHSVKQYADDIRAQMENKAAVVTKKGSFQISIPYINVGAAMDKYWAAGGTAYPGINSAPLDTGTTVKNKDSGDTKVTTAGGGDGSNGAKSGDTNSTAQNAQSTFNNLLGSVQQQTGSGSSSQVDTVSGSDTANQEEPTLSYEEIAGAALMEAHDFMVNNILPHQQQAVSPFAQTQLDNGVSGYSLGGPRYVGGEIVYSDAGKWGNENEAKLIFNSLTGQWEKVKHYTTWTRDGITYTMMPDGTIHGTDGTVWVTNRTTIALGTLGGLGGSFGDYGLDAERSDRVTMEAENKTLAAKVALLGDTTSTAYARNSTDVNLKIQHADADCNLLNPHTHDYDSDPNPTSECMDDANGKNPTGKKKTIHVCQNQNAADEGCDQPQRITITEGHAECLKPYASNWTAAWNLPEQGEGQQAQFVVTAVDIVDGTTVTVSASGTADTSDWAFGNGTPGSTTFTMTMQNGRAQRNIDFNPDSTTEGDETLTFTLDATASDGSDTGGIGDTIKITDTSRDPVPTYTAFNISSSTLNETGGTVTVTLKGNHLTDGATVTATVSGTNITRDDFTSGSDIDDNLQMTFTMSSVGNNQFEGTATIAATADLTTENNEVFTITTASVDSNGVGDGLTKTVSATISDDSITPPQPFENVQYYLMHSSGPDPEYVSFLLTSEPANFDLKLFFQNYGAPDRIDVYQGTAKWQQGSLLTSTNSTSALRCTSLTSSDLTEFRQLVTNIQAANPGEGIGGGPDAGNGLLPLGNRQSDGSREGAGKLLFRYNPANGRWITVKTKRGSGSSIFNWGMPQIPINEGEPNWYYEKSGGTRGYDAVGSSSVGARTATDTSTATGSANSAGVTVYTGTGSGSGGTVSQYAVPGSNLVVNPLGAWNMQGQWGYNQFGHIAQVGNGPGLGTKATARGAGVGNVKKRFRNDPSFQRGTMTAQRNDYRDMRNAPSRPLDGRPSFQNTSGGITNATDSPIPENSAFNPDSAPQKPKPKHMKITLLKKNKDGIYLPMIRGGSPAALTIPLDEYCNQPKIRFCTQNSWQSGGTGSGSGGDHSQYAIRGGDTFWIGTTQIDTTGVSSASDMKQRILQAMGDVVTCNITTDSSTGKQCVVVALFDNSPDPGILRNGCKGGVLKEVLDYTVNNKLNESFSSETYTAGSRTNTTTVSMDVRADTDANANTAPEKVGSVSTIASGTDYITNTITARQRRAANDPTTITVGHNGSGYEIGDILRAVGGTAVSGRSRPGMKIHGIKLINGGKGYGYINENGDYQLESNSVKITVGGVGNKGYGFELDTSGLSVDPSTGKLSCSSVTYAGTGGNYNGLRALQANDGSFLEGNEYVFDDPPDVNVIGPGEGAKFQVMWSNTEASEKEEVAVFKVTRTGDEGQIEDMRLLNRGLYETFPGDLNSGVPLEYHISKGDQAFSTTPTVGSRGRGKGGRVFMTARLVGDCREKGTAIQDMGLQEGPIVADDYDKNIVNYINDNTPVDPNGFPLFSAGLGTQGGLPGLSIGSPLADGILLEGNAPGVLESMNIDPGAYIPEIPPDIDLVDGSDAAGDGTGGQGGPDRGTSIRFKSTNPFAIQTDIGEVTVHGNLYKYELRRLDGIGPINMLSDKISAVHVNPLALQSQRYDTEANLDLATMSNVWIDNYNNTGGWAYLESNNVIRQQEKLVDTKFIRDVFTYDEVDAEKEFDVDLYDPFKGILPGFIGKEIDLRTEHDPVVYDGRKTKYGRKDVGIRWWDTSKVRYTWYEQGAGTYGKGGYNNFERSQNWGEMFPNSEIHIYEWVESLNPPTQYNGITHPIGNFITETHADKNGKPQKFYYFWARSLSTVSDRAKSNFKKQRSTRELEQLLTNIDAQRVAYTGIISPDAFAVNTLGSLIRTDESILSINFKRKDTQNAQKHTSWTLAGEGDRDGVIPEKLSIKLIDSLAGYNSLNQKVPGPGLSISERYGSKFRPRQTMFADIKQARKQMFVIMNQMFKDIQMNTTFIDWTNNMPAGYTLIEHINWYKQKRINKIDNSVVYYDSTYKPLRKVPDVKQFGLLQNVLDKSIVQVQKDDSQLYSLYEYNKRDDSFTLIAMEKETIKWSDKVYTDSETLAQGKEIRDILVAFFENIFVGTYRTYWNKFFFEMLKYAYAEQGELDWAFKTTYLKIVKEETDLIPFKGFKVDNFDKAIEYFNEVKPYSSKIRNYSDIKKAPVEILSGSTTDFDRPPYYDESTKSVRILDNANANDVRILQTDAEYAGFVSNTDKVRTLSQTIIFDRVKGSLYENSSGGTVQKVLADGTTTIFNLDFRVEDPERVQVFVNNELIPRLSYTAGNVQVENYVVDADNSFVTFTNVPGANNRIGIPNNGDKIEIKYIDGFDPTLETLNVSIAKNIVNIESNTNVSLSNTSLSWTAPERLWKFDPTVRQLISSAYDEAYGVGSSSNTEITTNLQIVTGMVEAGNFDSALNTIKSKVHATFQGEILDGNVFTDVVPGTHPTTFYTDTRGFDTFGWDDGLFDREVEVNNFVGVFNEDTQGNVNYRVNDETVYGFDGVTFLKSRYGPDRPEELAVVQPLETLLMDVYTKGNTQISSDSTDVRYFVFMDLFGSTEYYRRTLEPIATVTQQVELWSSEIFVDNLDALPDATKTSRGTIWINGERIEYETKDVLSNSIKGLTRGTKGTTPNSVIQIGEGIYNGEETENIRLRDANGNLIRDPEDFNWIKPVQVYDDTIPFDDDWDGTGSLTVTSIANINYANVTYDADNANITYGFDSSWDGVGSKQPTSGSTENYTLPAFDIDEEYGWDSGDVTFKESGSLTDKGTVLEANVSIIDFLHNFD